MQTVDQILASGPVLKAGDIVVSKNGGKASQVTLEDGKQLTIALGSPTNTLSAPFGLSQWDAAVAQDRVSLDVHASPGIVQAITALDESILKYVEANHKKYFGPSSKVEKVREYFRTTIRAHPEGKFEPLCRTKLSKSRVKVWNPDKSPGDASSIGAHSQVALNCQVRSLYFMNKSWGLTLETTHVMLGESPLECPWASEAEAGEPPDM
jgi:hypothetical protein